MNVKKHHNKVFGASFNAKEELALRIECDKYVEKCISEKATQFDAAVLYALHKWEKTKLGKQRLREFYDFYKELYRELAEHYSMKGDEGWLAVQKLKEIGVDVEAWNNEN